MPTASEYLVRLSLPEPLIQAYEQEAEKVGKPLDAFLATQLLGNSVVSQFEIRPG